MNVKKAIGIGIAVVITLTASFFSGYYLCQADYQQRLDAELRRTGELIAEHRKTVDGLTGTVESLTAENRAARGQLDSIRNIATGAQTATSGAISTIRQALAIVSELKSRIREITEITGN